MGAPAGTIVGHVHLRVGALESAEKFYAGTLGLDIACRCPGAAFIRSGGYHHNLTGNIWRSKGAPTRSSGSTGLSEVRLTANRPEFDAIRSRLGSQVADASNDLPAHDPWGAAFVPKSA
jgi:catechol 2,3-dioxygenase